MANDCSKPVILAFHPDGVIRIIDRETNQVGTQLKTCPVVENMVTLYEIGEKFGFSKDTSINTLRENIEHEVQHQVALRGIKCKLQQFEIPGKVKLCMELWTPEIGLVTAAFKPNRKEIQDRYQHELNRMYAS